MKRLWNELQPLEDFSSPPQKFDSRDFFLGGLCYSNADNPALFVPGPLAYAINVSNKRAYLYSAYVAGFVLFGILVHQHASLAKGPTMVWRCLVHVLLVLSLWPASASGTSRPRSHPRH